MRAPGALFSTGFSLYAAQIQRVFAPVELLRGVTAFLAAPPELPSDGFRLWSAARFGRLPRRPSSREPGPGFGCSAHRARDAARPLMWNEIGVRVAGNRNRSSRRW
jgi:hypothetical protein